MGWNRVPNNLSGKNIHLFRLISTIDNIFNRLASNRVYKKTWNDEKIFKLFKETRKKHPPKLIDIFFEYLDKVLDIENWLHISLIYCINLPSAL